MWYDIKGLCTSSYKDQLEITYPVFIFKTIDDIKMDKGFSPVLVEATFIINIKKCYNSGCSSRVFSSRTSENCCLENNWHFLGQFNYRSPNNIHVNKKLCRTLKKIVIAFKSVKCACGGDFILYLLLFAVSPLLTVVKIWINFNLKKCIKYQGTIIKFSL